MYTGFIALINGSQLDSLDNNTIVNIINKKNIGGYISKSIKKSRFK